MRSDTAETSEELAAAGATAPRVRLDDIKANIAFSHTFNAGEASRAISGISRTESGTALDHVTLCLMVMRNGYVVIGKSAVASLENFDQAKGDHFAREDALSQLWPLEGYALRNRLQAEAAGLPGGAA